MSWEIEIDQVELRKKIHQLYGGSGEGGISQSGRSPNVLLFETSRGQENGYIHDGPLDENGDSYYYTGAGRYGDQQFIPGRGNDAVLRHQEQGRTLRLFKEVSSRPSKVRYLGKYRLDQAKTHHFDEAPDRRGDPRNVIVFHLCRVDLSPKLDDQERTERESRVEEIDLEAHTVETFTRNLGESAEATRHEAELRDRYVEWLKRRGHTARSKRIPLSEAGRGVYLTTDLYDVESDELVEVKSSAARHYVRLALGQILDYARYVKTAQRAVLLPTRPSDDMIGLLGKYHVGCIYQDTLQPGEFHREDPSS
jgi:hypothetical protein